MAGLRHENKILKVGRIVTLLCFSYLPIAILGAAIALFPLLGFALTSALGGGQHSGCRSFLVSSPL